MDTTCAPDLVGQLLGFRIWILKEGKLISPFRSSVWSPGVNTATCRQLHCSEAQLKDANQKLCFNYLKYQGADKLKGALKSFARDFEWYDEGEQEKVPHPDCSCGIYAYFNPLRCLAIPCNEGDYRHGCQIDRPCGHQLLVMGAIKAQGRIEVHETGFRCQRAEIIALIVPNKLSRAFKEEVEIAAHQHQANYLETFINRNAQQSPELIGQDLTTQIKELDPQLISGPLS